MAKAVHTPAIRADYHDTIPLNRYGLETELAEAVFFLCSDRATYITGQLLSVDGGFEATGIGLPTMRAEGQERVGMIRPVLQFTVQRLRNFFALSSPFCTARSASLQPPALSANCGFCDSFSAISVAIAPGSSNSAASVIWYRTRFAS